MRAGELKGTRRWDLPRARRRVAALYARTRRFVTHDLWSIRLSEPAPPTLRIAILLGRILYIVVTGFRRERIKLRAAALTYVSLLSLVPALAVIFSLFAAFGGLEPVEAKLREFVVDALAVESHRQMLTQYLTEFVSKVHASQIGIFGVVILLFTVISLLANIEKSFNDIWGLERDRSLLQRFQVYWPLITLGPILLGLSLSISTAVEANATVRWLAEKAPALTLMAGIVPLLLAFIFFTFLYAVMPNTKVPVRYAAVGGMVAGALWVTAQKLYAIYAAHAITYSAIYGSLGAVPLFILWIYVSWIVALLGAQLTFASQSHATYEPEHEKQRKVPQRNREFLAARLLMAVSRAYEHGAGPVPTDHLVNHLLIPPRLARQVLNELVQSKLLVESDTGFVPGRPLDRISVADVVQVMRAGGRVHFDPHLIGEDALSVFVGETLLSAEVVLERELGKLTLAEVLERFEKKRADG